MKTSFMLYILACMTSLFIITSCEENTDQIVKTQPDTSKEITNRTIDDCGDCPLEYCCCSVSYLNPTGSAVLEFCGVYTNMPGSPCTASPGSPCSSISGSKSTMVLSNTLPRGLFCVPPGASFCITSLSGSFSIQFTCQHDHVDPPTEIFNFTGLQTRCFYNDGGCFLELCP